MLATYVAPVRTPVSPEEYCQALELAMGGDGKVPEAMLAILMAHSALETARWASMWNNGPGNVKCGPLRLGLYTCIRLNEYLREHGERHLVWFSPWGREKNGNSKTVGELDGDRYEIPPGHPQTRMRAYETLAEGVTDKMQFLRTVRYASALSALSRGDAVAYVKALHAAGYFTANLQPYIDGVVSLAKSYKLIARRVATEPLPLPEQEEQHVEACIELCGRGTLSQVNLIPLDVDWEQFKLDRDSSMRGV
jgi:hypothetical protein